MKFAPLDTFSRLRLVSFRLGDASAADRHRRFHFSDFGSGRTMELGQSGRTMMMLMRPPWRRRRWSYGGIDNRSPNLQH